VLYSAQAGTREQCLLYRPKPREPEGIVKVTKTARREALEAAVPVERIELPTVGLHLKVGLDAGRALLASAETGPHEGGRQTGDGSTDQADPGIVAAKVG
jgi:hypothetical protein